MLSRLVMTPGEMMLCGQGGEGEGSVVPPPLRIKDSSLDLCKIFFAVNQ